MATLAVVLSIRWLARRGALTALEPIVLAVRRNLADSIEARLFDHPNDPNWQEYPLIRRLWAAMVDLTLVFGITVLILTAASGLETTEVVLDPEGLLLLASVTLLYRVPNEARTGQTLGKLLMGISVYGPEGGVPGWWRAALRNAIGVLVFLWPIDAVLLLRRGHRQRLGDLAVRATVRRVSN
ncbi:MAG: RDD family protein [Chloroflexi bacterium]|nr:MAG: RDD family protein [Chloroflexota bacterium]